MTLIEKMVAAMEAERIKPKQFGLPTTFRDYAIAALTAAREPSEGMVDAGGSVEEWIEDGRGDEYQSTVGRSVAEDVWQAMIGAALKERG